MHILDNSSSFIDLIFTSQANFLIESGGHPSLHSNCHHQIIYSKFDLQDFYPPSYLREVWHYKDTKTELIRYSIAMFDWVKAFSKVHGKTTYEWHTMTYQYTRVTYRWHTSAYEWHTDDMRVHTSDMWMAYEYMQVTYGWHTSTYEWHTDDMRVHMSDIRMTYEYIRVTYQYIRVTYGWHTSTYCFGLFTKIKKGSGISFWCTFSAWVFHTNAPYSIHLININWQLTKFQRHIFLQEDIKRNVLLWSYLHNRWRHKL